MFKRILFDDWTPVVPIIAFSITFAFFLVVTIRACRMKKETRNHLAALPLEDDSPETH